MRAVSNPRKDKWGEVMRNFKQLIISPQKLVINLKLNEP